MNLKTLESMNKDLEKSLISTNRNEFFFWSNGSWTLEEGAVILYLSR